MSDGGIQKGYTFWATIRIAKEGVPKETLKEAMDQIRKILETVDGDIVHCTQADTDQRVIPGEMRQSPKFRAKTAAKRS